MKKYFAAVASFILLSSAVTPALAAWAIALAPGGDPLVARSYSSTTQAERNALEDCNARYGNCVIVETANSACASMANDGTKWGIGKGFSRRISDANALAACAAVTSRPCEVVHNFCGS